MKKLSRIGMAAVVAAALVCMPFFGRAFAVTTGKADDNPHAGAGGQQADMPPPVTGKVVETLKGGGYTYVQLEQADGSKVWVAAPEFSAEVGQVLMFKPGGVMPNFKSSTLKRTFDSVIFSPGLADASMVKGHGSQLSPGSTGAVPEKAEVKVEKAEGSNAYTIGEIYSKAGKLSGKEVTVRGNVVKVSFGIMGKNWIHLQDGTGSADKGTHDLVVTTSDKANKGDTVTAKGKVIKDKDFGSGYKYDVIMEDASISK